MKVLFFKFGVNLFALYSDIKAVTDRGFNSKKDRLATLSL